MQYISKKNSNMLSINKDKSLFSMVSAMLVTSAMVVSLLFSVNASADNKAMTASNKVASTVKQDEDSAKVSVNHQEMTAENKKKMPSSDSRIGAFSKKDGAMEGAYGDGDWSN